MRDRRRLPIWRWPLILGTTTVFGLGAALLGEGGLWWWLSWIALAMPLAVIAFFVARMRL